ncbi:histidine phosphatase family protein [Limosilactobacillus kribbianus]|uniref:histidine phosphatase family protein n=1 Tax=Limosilactobacillus kribbianus TaxID=2982695 RepID=UPI0022653643|nr:histidine phosphatase family protein [Limosilactobacillus kribbianus]
MTKITVDIVRHGETFLNTLNRAQGWIDFELDDHGKQQALTTGRELKDRVYSAVVSSDLKRAVETRDLIISQLQHKPTDIYTDRTFREVFFGYFEGLDSEANWRAIAMQHGYQDHDDIIRHESLEAGRNMMHDMDPTGQAESYEEVVSRWRRGIRRMIKKSNDGDRILLVTHGTFIRTIADALGVDTVGNFPVNAGVTTIEASDRHIKLLEYNHKFDI